MKRTLTHTYRAAALALTGGLVLTGGVAAAATGALPGASAPRAQEALTSAGVTVPGPDDHAGDHPATGGTAPTTATPPTTHGTDASTLARETESTGAAKGAEIAALASAGRSALHPGKSETPGKPDAPAAHGGTGTADEASGGASASGTSTAGAASGGASAAGSGNSQRP